MRLIDADTLIEKYGDWYTEEGTEEGYIGTVKGIVDSMPSELLIKPECLICEHCNRCKANGYVPTEQPAVSVVNAKTCKGCVNLPHGYKFPCTCCARNTNLRDWWEGEE